MNSKILCCICFICFLITSSCKKEFLDKKPSSEILSPTSIEDLNGLLENTITMNKTGGLPQLSADEYLVTSDQNFLSLSTATQRNAYRWSKDLFEGQPALDWDTPFAQIFYANSVLQTLEKNFRDQPTKSNFTKGWALFVRANAYYDLVRNFSNVYNPSTMTTDLGLPLRTSPNVDKVETRSTVKETFDFIMNDLSIAKDLLNPNVPESNKNRPSKAAVMALKARIFLYMGNYQMAELYADSTLIYHNKVIDYNSVSKTSTNPFGNNNDEVIYQSNQISAYGTSSAYGNLPRIEVNPIFIDLYKTTDLRKNIFFALNSSNKYYMKRGYFNGSYPFTGLATDEILLIKAECLARRSMQIESMLVLNNLLIKRYDNKIPYVPISAGSPSEALVKVLEERKKELIWRALRWSDIKRLNRDGANITLTRSIGGQTFSLLPNDPRYIFPIPDNEIALSGIKQNLR